MVTQSKESATDTIQEHPAKDLTVGNDDQISNLIKLHPINLPNDTIIDSTIEASRSSYSYLFVVNWIYNCRGFIKLQSENFDIDLFEIELLNLVFPPPVDESVLFINKLKVSLISTLQNSKLSSINNFEKLFRLWFGIETPLKGAEDEEDITPLPKFDYLNFGDKFEVLYILISYISKYPQFRTWIDKNGVTNDILRMNSIYTDNVSKGTVEDYFLLFDNSRLYKRTITIPSLQIPKKRKLAPEHPQEFYDAELFDLTDTRFEPIFKNIYEYNKTLLEVKRKKNKKNKALFSKLSNISIIDSMFQGEIRKRKILTNRRRELQLANLLATRKRSSRLEAKEKQRQEELRELKIQEEEEMRIAAEKRMERRRLVKEQLFPVAASTSLLSREERLKLRKFNSTESLANDVTTITEISESPPIENDEGIKSTEAVIQVNSVYPAENIESTHDGSQDVVGIQENINDSQGVVGIQEDIYDTQANVGSATDTILPSPYKQSTSTNY